jgi:hypothetical protein
VLKELAVEESGMLKRPIITIQIMSRMLVSFGLQISTAVIEEAKDLKLCPVERILCEGLVQSCRSPIKAPTMGGRMVG